GSKADGLAIGNERHVEQHDPAARARRGRVELLEAAYDEDVRLNSIFGSRDAPTQPEHHQRMTSRLDDVGPFRAPNPFRNDYFFGMHVFQAVLSHLVERPLNGSIQLWRAAQAVADRVSQRTKPSPREHAARRLANQPR